MGIYSAGLRSRQTSEPVVVAGIQSAYGKADLFGRFDLVVVDEAHLIAPDGDGMYRSFLDDMRTINPDVRLIGLTATPFRLKGGAICRPGNLLNEICYEANLKDMIMQGYLSPIVSRAGRAEADLSSVHIRGGEFVQDELASAMDGEELVKATCAEIAELTRERRSVLLFCTSVPHCRHVAETLAGITGMECAVVTGDTPAWRRDELIARFRGERMPMDSRGMPQEPLKYLCNVGVLTTGFDAPNVDCVAMLRPTQSPGLLLQIAGRGLRLSPETGKRDCLFLDYGGNILRHGPLDTIRAREPRRSGDDAEAPAKKCPECNALIHAGCGTCPECGYVFPKDRGTNLTEHASTAGVLSGEVVDVEYEVLDVEYSVHRKRGAEEDAPRTMRVEYGIGPGQYRSEWVCPEHSGYARRKFESWWRGRMADGCPVPNTAAEAVAWARAGALAAPKSITVRAISGEKYERVLKTELGTRPEISEELWGLLESGPLTEPRDKGAPPPLPADLDVPF